MISLTFLSYEIDIINKLSKEVNFSGASAIKKRFMAG
jgi:hypothetical protein